MNKGFILKALFLLCFLFSQTAQGQSFTPGEIWPDNHQVHINAQAEAFYMKTEPIIGLANTKQKVKPEI